MRTSSEVGSSFLGLRKLASPLFFDFEIDQ